MSAYQMFAEARGLPAAYQFLRVRLQFEQTRLLHWGEKFGLAEELPGEPSRVLQYNRNRIFDVLLEIQVLFKNTLKVQETYDRFIRQEPNASQPGPEDRFLERTLKALGKIPQAPQRLHWALIRQDEFKGLIEKIIGYNDAIEGLLESGAIDQLLHTQRQIYMSVLQLNSKVDDLKEISLAMQVQTQSRSLAPVSGGDEARTLDARRKDNQELADFASFKAQQGLFERHPSLEEPNPTAELVC